MYLLFSITPTQQVLRISTITMLLGPFQEINIVHFAHFYIYAEPTTQKGLQPVHDCHPPSYNVAARDC
jgi:hypothetical protein